MSDTFITSTQDLLIAVLDSSLAGIMAFKSIRDKKGEIVDFEWILANRYSENITGRKPESLIGKRLLSEMPGNQKEGLFDIYKDVVEKKVTTYLEKHYDQDNIDFFLSIQANPLHDGFVVTFEDITVRKKAEIELQEKNKALIKANKMLENAQNQLQEINEDLDKKVLERNHELIILNERFNLINKVTNDVIWDWDLETGNLWWNEGMQTLFGYDKEEIEPLIESWTNRIHTEDLKRTVDSIHKAIGDKDEQWSEEYRFIKKNGQYLYIFDRALILKDDSGKPYRLIGSMMDISKIKLAEKELREANQQLFKVLKEYQFVTDMIPQIIWTTNADGYHEFFNQRWYDFTGLNQDESIDIGWSKVLHPDDYNQTLDVWKDSLKSGKPYEVEYRFKRHDGIYRWFLGRALPLINQNGEIINWFGTCTDIHDLKMAREELIKINNDLDNFIYTASHDLKSPITNLEGLSNRLRKIIGTDPKTEPLFEMIEKSIVRFKNTIHDLTEIAKIEKVQEQETEIILEELITEIKEELESLIDLSSANIHHDFSEINIITFTKKNMRSLMMNLMTNALRYKHPDRTPEIKVKTKKNETSFSILVQDNGLGIKKEDQEKIFFMFKRLHANTEGSGVGLYIVKRIIENNNGKIDIISKENEGTTFKITLPLL
jgi:two-component system, chemotaxis family, CheB/CheR fusion protein